MAGVRLGLSVLLAFCIGLVGCSDNETRGSELAKTLPSTRDVTGVVSGVKAVDSYSTGADFGLLTSAELNPTGRPATNAPEPNLAAATLGVVRAWNRPPGHWDVTTAPDEIVHVESMALNFPDTEAAKAALASLVRFAAKDLDRRNAGSYTLLTPPPEALRRPESHQWLAVKRSSTTLLTLQVTSFGPTDRLSAVTQLAKLIDHS